MAAFDPGDNNDPDPMDSEVLRFTDTTQLMPTHLHGRPWVHSPPNETPHMLQILSTAHQDIVVFVAHSGLARTA